MSIQMPDSYSKLGCPSATSRSPSSARVLPNLPCDPGGSSMDPVQRSPGSDFTSKRNWSTVPCPGQILSFNSSWIVIPTCKQRMLGRNHSCMGGVERRPLHWGPNLCHGLRQANLRESGTFQNAQNRHSRLNPRIECWQGPVSMAECHGQVLSRDGSRAQGTCRHPPSLRDTEVFFPEKTAGIPSHIPGNGILLGSFRSWG